MLSAQANYIEELKFITSEICAGVFALQCLYLHRTGQIPMLAPCPEVFSEGCWQHTQWSLNQNLQDLKQVLGFLENSLKQPLPAAEPTLSV